MNKKNFSQVAVQAQKIRDALQSAVGPYIDAMDENGSEDQMEVAVFSFLVGCRAWIGSFRGLEGVILQHLQSQGFEKEDHVKEVYVRMCVTSNLFGEFTADQIRASMETGS